MWNGKLLKWVIVKTRKVELNLSNYATKSDLKGVINISASDFA